jgi:Zn-dependent M28 family amino/carboxypeptidase
MKITKYITAGLTVSVALLFFACNPKQKSQSNNYDVAPQTPTPDFNADSAYHYISKQVEFGPRVPNTDEHAACANYLASELKRFGADVIVQEATVTAFDDTQLHAKNIIGQFNPDSQDRILLFAHWDTRPFADYDPDESKRNLPIDGANDGGSGVGVLMEIARQLGKTPHQLGIDIIFFDAEDYGRPAHFDTPAKEHTWCLGSQHWARNPHKPGYKARYGILLDMVGAKNAFFAKERYSMRYAPDLMDKVWKTAAQLGFGHHFIDQPGGIITDDHVYVNELAQIPSIDIIQNDPTSQTSFGSFWHTHADNMDGINRETLKAVGQTVLEVIYNEY